MATKSSAPRRIVDRARPRRRAAREYGRDFRPRERAVAVRDRRRAGGEQTTSASDAARARATSGVERLTETQRADREAVLHERIDRDLEIARRDAQHREPAGVGGHVRIERALHGVERSRVVVPRWHCGRRGSDGRDDARRSRRSRASRSAFTSNASWPSWSWISRTYAADGRRAAIGLELERL